MIFQIAYILDLPLKVQIRVRSLVYAMLLKRFTFFIAGLFIVLNYFTVIIFISIELIISEVTSVEVVGIILLV